MISSSILPDGDFNYHLIIYELSLYRLGIRDICLLIYLLASLSSAQQLNNYVKCVDFIVELKNKTKDKLLLCVISQLPTMKL